MSRLTVIAAALVMGAAIAAPASACRMTSPYDPDKADIVFIGEAIGVDLNFNTSDDIKRFESSTVTFSIQHIIRGDYSGDTIAVGFRPSAIHRPTIDLSPLRAGDQALSVVGVQLDADIPGKADIVGGLCQALYYAVKPQADAPEASTSRWRVMTLRD